MKFCTHTSMYGCYYSAQSSCHNFIYVIGCIYPSTSHNLDARSLVYVNRRVLYTSYNTLPKMNADHIRCSMRDEELERRGAEMERTRIL